MRLQTTVVIGVWLGFTLTSIAMAQGSVSGQPVDKSDRIRPAPAGSTSNQLEAHGTNPVGSSDQTGKNTPGSTDPATGQSSASKTEPGLLDQILSSGDKRTDEAVNALLRE